MKQLTDRIEQLVRENDHVQDLALLASIDDQLLTGNERGYYCILLAESKLCAGEYELEAVEEAIEM